MTGPNWNMRSQPRPEILFSQPGVIYSNRMFLLNLSSPTLVWKLCLWMGQAMTGDTWSPVGEANWTSSSSLPHVLPPLSALSPLNPLRLAARWQALCFLRLLPLTRSSPSFFFSFKPPPVNLKKRSFWNSPSVFCEFQSLKWRHKNQEVANSEEGLWPWA